MAKTSLPIYKLDNVDKSWEDMQNHRDTTSMRGIVHKSSQPLPTLPLLSNFEYSSQYVATYKI